MQETSTNGAGAAAEATAAPRRPARRSRAGVCLARTLRSEVEVLTWSPIGGIQH